MSPLRPEVLLATADGLLFIELAQALETNGYPFIAVRSEEDAEARLTDPGGPKVAVLDRRLGADEIVRRARYRATEPADYLHCVLLDSEGDGAPDVAADSILPQPFDPFRMLVALQSILRIDTRKAVERVAAEETPDTIVPVIDPSTGIWDGDTIESYLELSLLQAASLKSCTGAIRVRIDGLDRVGEQFGDVAQSAVLRSCARLIRDRVRSGEGVGRIGPNEFLVVTRNQGPEGVTHVGDRIRDAVRHGTFSSRGGNIRLTASVGLAASIGGRETFGILDLAGEALIDAENAGGDRVVEWGTSGTDRAAG